MAAAAPSRGARMALTSGRMRGGGAGLAERGRLERTGLMRRAAIDIGTVTTRLLIADVVDGRVEELLRRTTVTHLGEGLHSSGVLGEAAMARVAEAVAGFVRDIESSGVEETVAVATSAARDAPNAPALLDALEERGLRARVISGDTEARLSFAGATSEMEGEDILVADLGGGSTELVLGSARCEADARRTTITAARSLDVGSRRLLDAFLHSDPPKADEMRDASEWTAEQLRPYFETLRERPREMVTLAGTGTTLSAVLQRLDPYDAARVHGSRLSGGDIAGIRDDLAALTVGQRRCVVGMDPARADVIVAGALILEVILGLAGLDSTIVSEHDILYGLVLEGA